MKGRRARDFSSLFGSAALGTLLGIGLQISGPAFAQSGGTQDSGINNQQGSPVDPQQWLSPGGQSRTAQQNYPQGAAGAVQQGYPQQGEAGTVQQGYPQQGTAGAVQQAYPQQGAAGAVQQGYPQQGATGAVQQGYPQQGAPGAVQQGYPQQVAPGAVQQAYPQQQVYSQQAAPSLQAPAGSDAGLQQSSAPPLVLHGGLEHSERLPPVEPQLQAGAIFTAQTIPKLEPNNEWYWIPAWYAGQKHVDSETIVRDYSFQTGRTITPNRVVMNRQNLAIGFQYDRNGQVWEFKRAPYTTTAEEKDFFSTMLVRRREPITVNQNLVVIRLVQTSINVDKRSHRIMKSMQQEQINTYAPAQPGVMNMRTSIRSFGADGNPLVEEASTRVVMDQAPFAPIDSYEGRNMRLLFRDYLATHGLSNYMPDDLRATLGQPAPSAYQQPQ